MKFQVKWPSSFVWSWILKIKSQFTFFRLTISTPKKCSLKQPCIHERGLCSGALLFISLLWLFPMHAANSLKESGLTFHFHFLEVVLLYVVTNPPSQSFRPIFPGEHKARTSQHHKEIWSSFALVNWLLFAPSLEQIGLSIWLFKICLTFRLIKVVRKLLMNKRW